MMTLYPNIDYLLFATRKMLADVLETFPAKTFLFPMAKNSAAFLKDIVFYMHDRECLTCRRDSSSS